MNSSYRTVISLMIALIGLCCSAQAPSKVVDRVKVTVSDSISGEPIPFASVTLPGRGGGALSDDSGVAHIIFRTSDRRVTASVLGYKSVTIEVPKGQKAITIPLPPSSVQLKEVTVQRKKEKYSKKNNPAVDFARSIKERQHLTDPRRLPNYNYNKYERITMGINNFTPAQADDWMFNRFKFLTDHVDTSEISGRPVLTLSVREKTSEVMFRNEPATEREYVTGSRRAGVDDVMSNQENLSEMLSDIFREVDLYQNDINILHNRFVSPLSRIATDFYKFYLTDTVMIEGERCIVLSFVPHNTAAFGFTGRVYVPQGDSTMFIKRVEMNVPHSINLNFIQNIYINQQFDRAPDGSRLKTHDDMVVEMEVLPGTPNIYVRRNTAYANHNFDTPSRPELLESMAHTATDPMAFDRPDEFWKQHRLLQISANELRVDGLMKQLRSVPLYYWAERTIKLLASGYVHTPDGSPVDIGPIQQFVSYNSVEGLRLQAGGLTTATLSKRWFARGYGAYGFRDHRWKYMAELEYSFIDKKLHSREFPVHSIRASHSYDIDEIGRHPTYYSNVDMLFSSFTRMPNNQMTYRRTSDLTYQLELANNFSVQASARHTRQEATDLMPFVNGYGERFPYFNQASFDLTLRYAPGEKFYQTKTERIPINLDAPVFTLSHSVSPKGVLGSMWTINRTEASFSKRFWLSAFGYIDLVLRGGHVWSRVPYTSLLTPNANISYLIEPESFALLNPLEFLTDTYATWDITYWLNGALFNYIPYFKKLKLREVISFRGYAGHLSIKNDPARDAALFRFPQVCNTQRLGHTPYMEVAVGLDNVLRIFRIDYVWRLNYRSNPGIDRSGVRASLHLTF